METIILDTYLLSISDQDFLVEGITPDSIKNILKDMKNMKPENLQKFLSKNSAKIKDINIEDSEEKLIKVAEKNGIKKENVTTSKVMLKRFFGTVLVGFSATMLFPITMACLTACVIRAIVKKESIINNTLSIIKEIRSGIKTTRRSNVTSMEKAIITSGQATDYLWGVLSENPLIIIKNLLVFIAIYIAAIFHFWKGIVFAGGEGKSNI